MHEEVIVLFKSTFFLLYFFLPSWIRLDFDFYNINRLFHNLNVLLKK